MRTKARPHETGPTDPDQCVSPAFRPPCGPHPIELMSMRIVVAVDGSPVSARVARHVVALAKAMRKPPAILLMVVDIPMMPGVERKIGAAAVRRFHE